MSQEVPTGDIIFGAVVLIILLVLAWIIGRFISSLKNKRFNQAWAPLVPLINGKIHHDGGGAATSWLTGSYKGKQVQASMIPNRNRYQEQSGERYNYFDVALMQIAGQQDWRITYKTAVFGLGKTGWQVSGRDENLSLRLQSDEIFSALAHLGRPEIEYSARSRTLRCSQDVTPQWVPTAQRFQEQLEELLLLETINEELNTT